jgi:aminocarboxymuconate-semialdehyde decarboxylase
LKQFYFDTISHNKEALEFLISRVGLDKVLMGTDYPYDMGDMKPLQSLGEVPMLTVKEKEEIMGENAISLYRII